MTRPAPPPIGAPDQAAPAAGQWRYWRPAAAAIVELGTLQGREVGLPLHLHAEDQLTFVLAGRRRFVLGGRMVVLLAGQGARIPAGVPHRSLAEPEGVLCLNAYLPAGSDAAAALEACRAAGGWPRGALLPPSGLAGMGLEVAGLEAAAWGRADAAPPG
ncbi:MAG: cupin domain-containing protein, partial [Paracraurococcus sp.]